MQQVSSLLNYLRENPLMALGGAAAVVAVYVLLNRKSRLTRQAEERIEALRRERGDPYNKLRPLQ